MTEEKEKEEKPTSSVATGGVTVTAAAFAPLISWALEGFPQPIPESIPYLLAAAIITIGHAIYNVRLAARLNQGKKQEKPL